ncbi:hypothetical protein [uncultured Clostridium sp.]|uniref:5-methylcytosine restriction system specificity protein McrC n=1 Tax=uncultured Clostridium sp. TaxID=59620 RepID=UPI002582F423|nr:hypothetical protein [uncultured Clostridium sp.]
MKELSKIPIENIYYMLCYAWNKLDYLDRNKVGILEENDVLNLLCRIFVNEVNFITKKGINREYNSFDEEVSTIKGKININKSIELMLSKKNKLNCGYEELDFNITINKILKTTIINLLKTKNLSEYNKKYLKNILFYFSSIDTIYLNERLFNSIKYNTSNKSYKFIINICKLINDNLLIAENGEEAEFYNFLEDERKMAYLFENFIRNFYKKELKSSKVYRENIKWNLKGENLEYIPKMETDISIEFSNKKIIMDTKYYKNALNNNFGKDKLISGNLYQLFAYLKNNENKSFKDKNSEGILIYPRVNIDLDLRYTMENHIIKICTVNLNMKWNNIKDRLLTIIL